MNIKELGQVFTPPHIVSKMLQLRKNKGTVLEPSCGDGAFSNKIPNCTAIELDAKHAPSYAMCMDFFDYDISNKFDTIIGNPPYVRFQDIQKTTKEKLNTNIFDERSNLYLFFIYKCIKHLNPNGELIFIVPRELMKATSAIKLNEFIYENGTITDLVDLGDLPIFKGACPNTIIFRFEKDNFTRKTNTNEIFNVINGQMFFTTKQYNISFSDLFFVKVGAVSGADKYFISEKGNLEFVCSTTKKDGKTRRMFYDVIHPDLEKHKSELLKRQMKKFDDTNWYQWGRKYYISSQERIYVNSKTRNKEPFFTHDCKAYDGSVLAIFPKFDADKTIVAEMVQDLNKVDWQELGFVCDGRYLFSQKALENTVLPNDFQKYLI